MESTWSSSKSSQGRPTDLFLALTPERVLAAVEAGGLQCNNLCYPLNSFENRVYEVGLTDSSRVVAKFYRPERWTEQQILEEHRFLQQLDGADIPVCTVRAFPDGPTLKQIDNIYYSLSDRRGGRAPDELNASLALRLGMLVGRMHNVAAADPGSGRRPIDGEHFIRQRIVTLENSRHANRYRRGKHHRCCQCEPHRFGRTPALWQRRHGGRVNLGKLGHLQLGHVDLERFRDLQVQRPILLKLVVVLASHSFATLSFSLCLARCRRVRTAPCFKPIISAISLVL